MPGADEGQRETAGRECLPTEELPLSGTRGDGRGIGGVLKQQAEDFCVEEIPAYTPCGEGEHLFLWIEKRGLSSEQLSRHVARQLGVKSGDVGMAGMKDRQAVTRQFISVPATAEGRVAAVDSEQVRVLDARRHGNKLRTGHLRGNRFEIVVRGVEASAADPARRIARGIVEHGFANYYGEQRFGRDRETLDIGLRLLRGEIGQRDLPRERRRFLLRLSLSAVQSYLFNRCVAERIREGLFRQVVEGDVMQKVDSGGPFVAVDVAVEQRRFEAGETVISGPLFGPKMRQPQGEAARREAQLLAAHGLSEDHFRAFPKLTSGTRRPILIRPAAIDVEPHADGLLLRFTLPPGCYATMLLREFLLP